MEIFETVPGMRAAVKKWKKEGCTIGLVPTMGYLHEGHASLVKESVANNDKTVVSVFLNPIQFGPGEDFSSYPRDFGRDKALLESLGADAAFHPDAKEMYGSRPLTEVYVKKMSSALCGKTRPIHFCGVATVVSKLFNIVTPDRAYFGSKDFQQLKIIEKMTKDLDFDVEIIGMPTVRDKDGLALSSRNIYLKPEERRAAVSLSRSIALAEEAVKKGETDAAKIIKAAEELIMSSGAAKIDYIKIVDAETLKEKETVTKSSVMALAVYVGKTRLIDNGTLVS